MKLYFQQANGTRRFLQFCQTEKEAVTAIYEFCKTRNFKIYYTRIWEENGEIWRDVGSHSEFFVLTDVTRKEEENNENANG